MEIGNLHDARVPGATYTSDRVEGLPSAFAFDYVKCWDEWILLTGGHMIVAVYFVAFLYGCYAQILANVSRLYNTSQHLIYEPMPKVLV